MMNCFAKLKSRINQWTMVTGALSGVSHGGNSVAIRRGICCKPQRQLTQATEAFLDTSKFPELQSLLVRLLTL